MIRFSVCGTGMLFLGGGLFMNLYEKKKRRGCRLNVPSSHLKGGGRYSALRVRLFGLPGPLVSKSWQERPHTAGALPGHWVNGDRGAGESGGSGTGKKIPAGTHGRVEGGKEGLKQMSGVWAAYNGGAVQCCWPRRATPPPLSPAPWRRPMPRGSEDDPHVPGVLAESFGFYTRKSDKANNCFESRTRNPDRALVSGQNREKHPNCNGGVCHFGADSGSRFWFRSGGEPRAAPCTQCLSLGAFGDSDGCWGEFEPHTWGICSRRGRLG